MEGIINLLKDPRILIYLGIVIRSQIMYGLGTHLIQSNIRRKRKNAGLPDGILINHTEKLSSRRIDALVQSGLLLASILITPFVLVWITESNEDKSGLAIAFLVLLGWILFNGTDVIKAFLGDLAFKTIAAFKQPF